MSADGSEYWIRVAAETHAKLVNARALLAEANSANHQRHSRVRADTLALLERIKSRGLMFDTAIRAEALALLEKMGGER